MGKGKKSVNGNIYVTTYTKWTGERFELVSDKDGRVMNTGNHRAACLPEELPDWYLKVKINNHIGYVNTKKIPNMIITQDLNGEQVLLISYTNDIKFEGNHCGPYGFRGYDIELQGEDIVRFKEALIENTGFIFNPL